MSYNGSGTFNINTAGQPVVTGTVITSTAFNALTADLATGLTTAVTKDGQTTPTANLPMGTYRHTGVGNATARTDYASAGQVADSSLQWGGTAGGTVDVITISVTPAITAYAAGQAFRFLSSGANTTNVTINVNGVGAKAITKAGTTALAAGDIPSGATVDIVYDGTRFQIVSIVLNVSAFGKTLIDDASASDARTTLGAVGLTGNETIAGNKTFSGSTTLSGTTTASATFTMSGAQLVYGTLTSIAGASTVDLGAATTNNVLITGTSFTCTSFGTGTNGQVIFCRAGSTGGIIQHGGSAIICPNGVDLNLVANDTFIAQALGSGAWVIYGIVPAGTVIGRAFNTYTTYTSMTTTIPGDDTIPQNTEGTETVTCSYTPARANSRLRVTVTFNSLPSSGHLECCAALFRDSTANAVFATQYSSGNAGAGGYTGTFVWEEAANAASSTTYKLRLGPQVGGTLYVNGNASARRFGGVMAHTMVIEEIKG
jgi:hypothetical protein